MGILFSYKNILLLLLVVFLFIFFKFSQNGRYQFCYDSYKKIIDTRSGKIYIGVDRDRFYKCTDFAREENYKYTRRGYLKYCSDCELYYIEAGILIKE